MQFLSYIIPTILQLSTCANFFVTFFQKWFVKRRRRLSESHADFIRQPLQLIRIRPKIKKMVL